MISPKEYDKIVKKNSPKSTIFKNCLMAFLIGGAICTVGQGLLELYQMWGLDEDTSKTLTSVTLIFFGILLTAIGVYDKIAKHAIEFKAEGYVTGLGAKLFIIAGPVIVYGVSASIIYGAVLWILHMFGITLF